MKLISKTKARDIIVTANDEFTVLYKRIIDEHEFVHQGRTLVNRLEFRGDDKYIVFMWDETMYLLEIETDLD